MPVSNQVRESVVKGTKLCIRKECRTINSRNFPQVLHRNKQRKTLWNQSISEGFGPSGAIRTLGPVNPNHVRYQLRYTRIFCCHDYSTKTVRFKVFSWLWSFMWSKRFFCPVSQPMKIPQVLVSQGFPGFGYSCREWICLCSQTMHAVNIILL